VPQIEVTFDIDSNGIVGVLAKNLGTGKEQKVIVRPTSGLSESEVGRIISEAEQNREADKTKKEMAHVRNSAEALIYGTEQALEEFSSTIDASARADVEAKLHACQAAIASGDIVASRVTMLQLEEAAQSLFEALQ